MIRKILMYWVLPLLSIYVLSQFLFYFTPLSSFLSSEEIVKKNDKPFIMVIGGAGYVGSHVVKILLKNDYNVVIFDNLVKGHREVIDILEEMTGKRAYFSFGDVVDINSLRKAFSIYHPDVVINLSAKTSVFASSVDPYSYYKVNVGGFINILNVMEEFECKFCIFSSSGAVYGTPTIFPTPVDHPNNPVSQYGQTKLMGEKLLKACEISWGLKYIVLRFTNVAGADESGMIGEDHSNENHLIPKILQIPLGKRKTIKVFGNDYDTKDGTCVRDFIHVNDIAAAKLNSVKHLLGGGESHTFNVGSGVGNSILEVIETAEKVSGKEIKYEIHPRRTGDPARTTVSVEKTEKILNWKKKYSLEEIIESAFKWHKRNPNGYLKT